MDLDAPLTSDQPVTFKADLTVNFEVCPGEPPAMVFARLLEHIQSEAYCSTIGKPTEADRSVRPLQEKLEALMATPGEWGQIGTYPSVASAYSVATAFRLGKRPRPPGRWEFRGQQLDGGGEVRARYIGPEEKS